MRKARIVPQVEYFVDKEPYYEPVGNEVEVFDMAFNLRRPLALLGPTGCGKTALANYMTWRIRQKLIKESGDKGLHFPYIEVPCHEDLTIGDLVGRYGLKGEWLPGPLYTGALNGGIVLLDEIVEARKDAVVMIHALTDDRRHLPLPQKGEVIIPPEDFMIVICYNPGYQVKAKDLKPSTRQRFVTLEMDYPPNLLEEKIIIKHTGVDPEIASQLVSLGDNIRKAAREANQLNLQEGASTRLLIRAAEFYHAIEQSGATPNLRDIARYTIFSPISTEDTDRKVLEEMLSW